MFSSALPSIFIISALFLSEYGKYILANEAYLVLSDTFSTLSGPDDCNMYGVIFYNFYSHLKRLQVAYVS